MYEWIGRLTRHETGGASRAAGWAARLPRGLVHRLLRAAGLLLYAVMGGLRRTICGNMEQLLTGASGPDRAAKASARRMARRYFEHAACTLYELLLESAVLPEDGEERILIEGEAHLAKALEDGKGAILYAPHVGNFFYYYWRLSRRYKCLAVATASSPEIRSIYLRFERLGCRGLDYDETPPLELMRRLKAHLSSGGVVFLLGDFYRPSFPEARLFGRKTRSPAGAAQLALDLQTPVIPCCGFREPGMKHRVVLEEPVYLHEAFTRRERAAATEALNARLEDMIRRKPEQWFYWFDVHERWI